MENLTKIRLSLDRTLKQTLHKLNYGGSSLSKRVEDTLVMLSLTCEDATMQLYRLKKNKLKEKRHVD